MGPDAYAPDNLSSTKLEEGSGRPCSVRGAAENAGPEDSRGSDDSSSSVATNSARTSDDCPRCAFLREQLGILVESRGELIAQNFALAARANAAEAEIGRRHLEERRQAEFLVGLANLQRVEAAG